MTQLQTSPFDRFRQYQPQQTNQAQTPQAPVGPQIGSPFDKFRTLGQPQPAAPIGQQAGPPAPPGSMPNPGTAMALGSQRTPQAQRPSQQPVDGFDLAAIQFTQRQPQTQQGPFSPPSMAPTANGEVLGPTPQGMNAQQAYDYRYGLTPPNSMLPPRPEGLADKLGKAPGRFASGFKQGALGFAADTIQGAEARVAEMLGSPEHAARVQQETERRNREFADTTGPAASVGHFAGGLVNPLNVLAFMTGGELFGPVASAVGSRTGKAAEIAAKAAGASDEVANAIGRITQFSAQHGTTGGAGMGILGGAEGYAQTGTFEGTVQGVEHGVAVGVPMGVLFAGIPAAGKWLKDQMPEILARRTLGLPFTGKLTPEQVKQAYRETAKSAHPDSPTGSDEAFVRVSQAYETVMRKASPEVRAAAKEAQQPKEPLAIEGQKSVAPQEPLKTSEARAPETPQQSPAEVVPPRQEPVAAPTTPSTPAAGPATRPAQAAPSATGQVVAAAKAETPAPSTRPKAETAPRPSAQDQSPSQVPPAKSTPEAGAGKKAIEVSDAARADRGEVQIEPSRYAKAMMAVRTPSKSDFITDAGQIARALSNKRYSGRENAYIMSRKRAELMDRFVSEGWSASLMGDKMTAPDGREMTVAEAVKEISDAQSRQEALQLRPEGESSGQAVREGDGGQGVVQAAEEDVGAKWDAMNQGGRSLLASKTGLQRELGKQKWSELDQWHRDALSKVMTRQVAVPEIPIASMTYSDLRARAKELGLSPVGARKVLEARVRGAVRSEAGKDAIVKAYKNFMPQKERNAAEQPQLKPGMTSDEIVRTLSSRVVLKSEESAAPSEPPGKGRQGKELNLDRVPALFPRGPGLGAGRYITSPADFILRLAKEDSDFRADPKMVFTKGKVVVHDGATYRFEPDLFGIDSKTPEGTVFRIDLAGMKEHAAENRQEVKDRKAVLSQIDTFNLRKEYKRVTGKEKMPNGLTTKPDIINAIVMHEFGVTRPSAKQPLPPPPPQGTVIPRKGPGRAGGVMGLDRVAHEIAAMMARTGGRIGSAAHGATTAARYYIQRGTKFMEHWDEPGRKLAKDVRTIAFEAHRKASNDLQDIRDLLKGVSSENAEKVMKAADGKADDKTPKWIKDRGERVKSILDRVMNEFAEVGGLRTVAGNKVVPHGSGRAFPQVPNAEGKMLLDEVVEMGQSSSRVLKAAEYMVQNHQANNVTDAVAQLVKFRDRQIRGINPYLEKERIELPPEFREWNPNKVLPHTLDRGWKLVEAIRIWGVDDLGKSFPHAVELIEEIRGLDRKKYRHANSAANDIQAFIKSEFGGGTDAASWAQAMAHGANAWQTISKLGFSVLSPIRNGLDRYAKGFTVGTIPTNLQAIRRYPPIISTWMKSAKEIEDQVMRRGALFSVSTLSEGIEKGGAITHIAMAPFSAAERGNQVYEALVRRIQVEKDLAALAAIDKSGKVANFMRRWMSLGQYNEAAIMDRLQRSGVNNMTPHEVMEMVARGNLTEDEIAGIMHRASRDLAFPVMLGTKRIWWDRSPFVRVMGKFKTWGVDQIGHIHNDVLRQTIKGNFAVFPRFVAAMIFTGELYNLLRDLIFGDDESMTMTAMKRPDRMNAEGIAKRLASDFMDGGGLGIFADMTYGLVNLIGGPTLSTAENVKQTVMDAIKRPSQTATALREFFRKEIAVSRQVSAVIDKVDRRVYNESNHSQEYYRWRKRTYEWADESGKNTEGNTDFLSWSLFGMAGIIEGRGSFDRTSRSLSYEMAARQITVGDIDDAAEYLRVVLKDAKTNDERKSIITGMRGSMRIRSPLGHVAKKDLNEFLSKFPSDQQAEARRLQSQWIRDYEEAIRRASR